MLWEGMAKPVERLRYSNPRSHLFTSGNLLPPTLRDGRHIEEYLKGLKFGENYFFEKTIFQNQEPTGFHRIIHLFGGVDENGILRKVSINPALHGVLFTDEGFQRIVVKVQGYLSKQEAIDGTMAEFGLHKELSDLSSTYILKCHGHSVRDRSRNVLGPSFLGYGYLEFAPFGDLSNVIIRTYLENR